MKFPDFPEGIFSLIFPDAGNPDYFLTHTISDWRVDNLEIRVGHHENIADNSLCHRQAKWERGKKEGRKRKEGRKGKKGRKEGRRVDAFSWQ